MLCSLALLAVLCFVLLRFTLGCGALCFVVVASLLVCIGFALAGFLLRFSLLLLVCGVCFLCFLLLLLASCCFLLLLTLLGCLRCFASLACFLLLLLASCFLLLASLAGFASLRASNFCLVCGSCWALSVRYLGCFVCGE